jgi:hypothetical protein
MKAIEFRPVGVGSRIAEWFAWRGMVRVIWNVVKRTRHVDDDFAIRGAGLFVDRGKRAEQQAVNVGQDGGAARRDTALLEGEREIPEVGVDVGGGFAVGEILANDAGKVDGVGALCVLAASG